MNKTPKQCCEACRGGKNECTLKRCSCHQPKPEVKLDAEKFYKEHNFTSVPPSPASTEEWEKEFDELITKTNWVELYDAIKSFIRSHDQQLRQRIVREIDRLEKEVLPTHAEENGYSCALEDFRTFITNLK